jgi:Uma2 family endonuclease
MATIAKGFTVDQYDELVAEGILPETNRFELIGGRIEEKDVKGPAHRTATERTRRALEALLPAGWFCGKEDPVRIPDRDSEPEPDLSVVRGSIDDYGDRHPGPQDVALVVEITRTTVAKNRAMAAVYGAGGIPVYWIANLREGQVEVYTDPDAAGGYRRSVVYKPGDAVPVMIMTQVVGQIPVSEILPRPRPGPIATVPEESE